ncbi:MAG: glycosyltransferase family 2 protein [Deltaproteobacteria bacterium]|nr:glycosyltransferase family 2 protein [Deltaproteobacteria bacterium]
MKKPIKKISLCMIVKNEEKILFKSLNSVKNLVDEMIVVDTGSSDRTKEIADSFGAKVFDFKWIDDFSAARNYSISKSSGDWILILDADEYLIEDDFESIRKCINDNSKDVYCLKWQFLNEKKTGFKSFKVGLFRNKIGIRYQGLAHEEILKGIDSSRWSTIEATIFHEPALDRQKDKEAYYYELVKRQLALEPESAHWQISCGIHSFMLGFSSIAKEHWIETLKIKDRPIFWIYAAFYLARFDYENNINDSIKYFEKLKEIYEDHKEDPSVIIHPEIKGILDKFENIVYKKLDLDKDFQKFKDEVF